MQARCFKEVLKMFSNQAVNLIGVEVASYRRRRMRARRDRRGRLTVDQPGMSVTRMIKKKMPGDLVNWLPLPGR